MGCSEAELLGVSYNSPIRAEKRLNKHLGNLYGQKWLSEGSPYWKGQTCKTKSDQQSDERLKVVQSYLELF